MKRLLALLLALLAATPFLMAQNGEIDLDKEFFSLPDDLTPEMLDTINIPKHVKPNDYWIVGVHGGTTALYGYFNPSRTVSPWFNYPTYGFSITRYATLLATFPMVGMELGFQHTYEGYKFKENKQTHIKPNIRGAYEVLMEVPEVYLLTHGHYDIGEYAKILIKAGIYGGYRMNIHREGPWVEEGLVDAFHETDNRYTYGTQFALGFGLMFDPFEIHLTAQLKWGWSSFFQPDYLSPYYYRFAYPLDLAICLGVYYQLTPRHGHTRAQLRRMARQIVENE